MKRYGSIEYVMNMKAEQGFKLIQKAVENEVKDLIYQQYCAVLPVMLLGDKDKDVLSFEEFYQKSIKPQKKVTKEEAYQAAEDILKVVCKKA